MPITLSKVPGFNDTPDSVLTQNKVALGVHAAAINDNAAFGLVRTEVFQGIYKSGDTIPAPTSAIDGYTYARNELMYIWGIYSTANPDTGWITGPDALWYMGWNIDQATGVVSSIEWYRPWANAPAQSADGQLIVWVVGVRQKNSLTMSAVPTFTDLADATFYEDAPWKQATARGLSRNSKYGVVSTEIIYMGEFWTGKTIPQPVSLADGHTYAYADVKFIYSWRWTTDQASLTQPVWDEGQFAGMFAAINPTTGAVSLSVKYIRGGGEGTITTHTNHGRIAVWALCDRNSGVSLGAPATAFAEVTQDHFYPGKVLQASTLSQVNKNIREAIVTPEFFGPTTYYHGQTVPVPTSPVDGHVYTRQECFYVWEWDSAAVGLTGHNREAEFNAAIDPSNGKVRIDVWRLPPGGGYSHQHGDGSTYGSIRVTVIACRTANNNTATTHTCLPLPTLVTSTGGATGGTTVDFPTGTAVKIFGDQEFPATPVQAMVTVGFTSSNDAFNSGVCNLLNAKIAVTAKGSTVVLANYPITFGGSPTTNIAASATTESDPVGMVLDRDHDYYILCVHFGAEAQIGYNNAAVILLHGKIESTARRLNMGSVSFPTPTAATWFNAPDLSTYLAFPAASDVWSVISSVCYDVTPVAPPVDAGSLTSDSAVTYTVNGA